MNNLSYKMPEIMIEEFTQLFDIERNCSIIGSAHGFFCGRDYPSTIQLTDNIDIQNGDWIIDRRSKQRYFVKNAYPIYMDGELTDWMVRYQTEYDYNLSAKSHSTINIQNVNGNSVIGSQENVTLNIGSTLQDIQNLVEALPNRDQALAKELLAELKETDSLKHPVLIKGSLSKFSDLLKKHTDLFTAIGGWAVQLLIGK